MSIEEWFFLVSLALLNGHIKIFSYFKEMTGKLDHIQPIACNCPELLYK